MRIQWVQDLIDSARGKKKTANRKAPQYELTTVEGSYFCPYIKNSLSFFLNDIINMCCFTAEPCIDIATVKDRPADIVVDMLGKKNRDSAFFASGQVYKPCLNCPNLKKAAGPGDVLVSSRISSVAFNTFSKCNLKCIYCYHTTKPETLPDTDAREVINVLRYLFDQDLMAPEPMFIFGGGEPGISRDTEELVSFLMSRPGRMLMYSNGTRFSPTFADAAGSGKMLLTITADAGSREVYKTVKGVDFFDRVWANIAQYVRAGNPDSVQVKFILQKENVDDIDNMIDACVEAGVKKVMVSIDLNINPAEYPDYAPHFERFGGLCQDRGLESAIHFFHN